MKYTNTLIFLVLIIVPQTKAVFQVIGQPGLYQLGENVTYSPVGPNDIIFQITSSDVEFDLGDRFIAQDSASVETGLIAIQVASGLSNVTIKSGDNGSIQNIRGTGIQVLESCSRITLDNITTFSCVERAIDFIGGDGVAITDSQIQNCRVISCCRTDVDATVVSLETCNNLRLKNIIVENNGLQNSSLSVITINNCNNCNASEIFMLNNTALTVALSLSINATLNSVFSNCLIENHVATDSGSTSIGYTIGGSSNNIFKNCNIVTLSGGNLVVGFSVTIGANNIFENCLVKEMTGSIVNAFDDEANTGTTFINCGAYHNTASNVARGFFVSSTAQSNFINCIVTDQTSTANTGVGFEIESSTDTLMQNCLATRNTGSLGSFGVLAVLNTNDVYVHNVASRNGPTPGNQFSGVAAGAVNTVLATAVNSAAIGSWTNLGIT